MFAVHCPTPTLFDLDVEYAGFNAAKTISDSIESGSLDITLYRDDLEVIGPRPVIGGSELPPGGIDDKCIVIVDDESAHGDGGSGDAPTHYEFDSRFELGTSSVSYSGQTFRQALVTSLVAEIDVIRMGARTADPVSWAATSEPVMPRSVATLA